uniref:Placenta associated 8 B n=2 Tax=Bos TaxID=9903 RepID=A0A3Q1M2C0_BOVIN
TLVLPDHPVSTLPLIQLHPHSSPSLVPATLCVTSHCQDKPSYLQRLFPLSSIYKIPNHHSIFRSSNSIFPEHWRPHFCLCGTFCFTCLACQVASDMNECCLCGTSVAMRTLYRTRYGIPGSICDDFMVTHCCPLCSLCQIKRDINRRRANRTF